MWEVCSLPKLFQVPFLPDQEIKIVEKDGVLACTSLMIRNLPTSNLSLCLAHITDLS